MKADLKHAHRPGVSRWIDEHRNLPQAAWSATAQVWEDADFIVTVVGGPNQRTDSTTIPTRSSLPDEGERLLNLMENGRPGRVELGEGAIFLMPRICVILRSVRRPGAFAW